MQIHLDMKQFHRMKQAPPLHNDRPETESSQGGSQHSRWIIKETQPDLLVTVTNPKSKSSAWRCGRCIHLLVVMHMTWETSKHRYAFVSFVLTCLSIGRL